MTLCTAAMCLSAGTGWPTTSTSSGQPRGCSCTPWPPASARSSICTASGPSRWTRAAHRSSTTTTTLWSTSTPPAPVLTPCRWSSGLWAHCTDRGRSSSTLDPATVGGTRRNHLRRRTEIFKATPAVDNSLPTLPSSVCFYGTIFTNWNDLFLLQESCGLIF